MLLNNFLNDPQKMGMLSMYLMQQAQGDQNQQPNMGMQILGAANGLAGILNQKQPATGDPLPNYLQRTIASNAQSADPNVNYVAPWQSGREPNSNIPGDENYRMPTMNPDDISNPNNIGRLASAIGQVESSGRYDALGQQTKSGDRAYGKYQVMGNNIPTWSKEVLGYSVTPQQFLANPQLQDTIAQAKLAQYHQKYGNAGDVASAWFSGRPLKNNYSRDVTGTSVPEYVQRVYGYL